MCVAQQKTCGTCTKLRQLEPTSKTYCYSTNKDVKPESMACDYWKRRYVRTSSGQPKNNNGDNGNNPKRQPRRRHRNRLAPSLKN